MTPHAASRGTSPAAQLVGSRPCRVTALVPAALLVMQSGAALAQRDALVQPPALARPERGALIGSLAELSFGARELERGAFSLPAAISLPSERGAPLWSVVPSYSPESGISEWGVGWSVPLVIKRFRVSGDFDYQTDDFTSPWGRLRRGTDGDYHPSGLGEAVRLRLALGVWEAILPNGTRVQFDHQVVTPSGTYAWYATHAETIFGDRTEIEYVNNASGRPFVSRVYYGGRSHPRAYRVDLSYELLAQPVFDYSAGRRIVLDRRVTQAAVFAQHAQDGTYGLRWRTRLGYLDSELGPAFYLRSVTTTYASGQSEPPVTYEYELGEERVGGELRYRAGPLEEVATLRGYLSMVRDPDGFQPDRVATLDDEENGVPDLEWPVDFSLYRQGPDGRFTREAAPPRPPDANPLCRTRDSSLNPPRNLVRMEGPGTSAQVLFLDAHFAQTEVLVCDRAGRVLHRQVVNGSWVLGANTRVVDLNNDQKPDLLSVDYGEYQVLENISGEGCEPGSGGPCTPFGFVAHPVRYLEFFNGIPFLPTATWTHDMNGDGHADLVLRYDEGVSVWYGRGHGVFDPQEYVFPFIDLTGREMTRVSNFEIVWVDPNKEGHTDAVLSVSGGSYLFMNGGDAFREVRVISLEELPSLGWDVSTPVGGDLRARGNTELFFSTTTNAYAISLQQAGTGLLRLADDGKGTRLSFRYERAAPYPGLRQRPSVLAEVRIQSSGYDEVTHSYAYDRPVSHTAGHFFVGFSETNRHSPFVSETVTFHHDDDVSGLVVSAAVTDERTPGIARVSETTYEEANLSGVRFLRPRHERNGFIPTGGGAGLTETVEYLLYGRDLCPTQTRATNAHGTVTVDTVLASVLGLDDALHCLWQSERLTGRHAAAALDFVLEQSVLRNDRGQVTRVTQHGIQGALIRQEATYDTLHRVVRVSAPGRGTTTVTYDAATGLAHEIVAPDGVVARARARDPLTGALRELVSDRGAGGTLVSSFRFDGLERLEKAWKDFGGSSELHPVEQIAYHFPTSTTPGAVVARELIDPSSGAANESAALVTAAGEPVATLGRIPEGWRVPGVTSRSRVNLSQTTRRRGVLPPTTDVGNLPYATLLSGAIFLGEGRAAGFGHTIHSRQVVQSRVERIVETSKALGQSGLVTTTVENGLHTTRATLDAKERILSFEDQERHVTRYAYDALGRVVGVTLPDGTAHTISYDSYGRPDQVERDGVGSITYEYAPTTGLPSRKKVWDTTGLLERTIDFSYDGIGRVTAKTHTLARNNAQQTFYFTYDGAHQRPPVPGQKGHQTRVESEHYSLTERFNPDGTLAASTFVLPGWREVSFAYTYYANGAQASVTRTVWNLETNTLINRLTQDYLYDANGRLSRVRASGADLFSLRYNTEGLLDRVNLPGGQLVSYRYDATTHNVSGHTQNAGAWISGVDWSFDQRGHVASESLAFGVDVWDRAYTYGARGFLTRSQDRSETASYSYGSTGLPASISDRAETRTLRRVGREMQAGSVRYVYDDLGRVVQKGDLVMHYGPSGHLDPARRGGRQWNFFYDEGGNRILKKENGRPVAAYVGGAYITETAIVEPVYLAGRIVGVFENGQFHMLAMDPRGTLLADRDGTPKLGTPYGVRALRPDLSAALDYVEKRYDPDLGLIRMGVRDYDPFISQFLTPDPLFLEALDKCVESPIECNLYAYALNNPVQYKDSSGQCVTLVGFAICVAVGLVAAPSIANAPGPGHQTYKNPSATEIGYKTTRNVALAGGGHGVARLASHTWRSRQAIKTAVVEGTKGLAQDTAITAAIGAGAYGAWHLLSDDPSDVSGELAAPFEDIFEVKLLTETPTRAAVDPRTIRFTQGSIGRTFAEGGTLRDVIEGLRKGDISPEAFPPIRVFERNGLIFTLDNRRLFVFQEAGIQISTVPATAKEVISEAWKFTTRNEGVSIRVRGGL